MLELSKLQVRKVIYMEILYQNLRESGYVVLELLKSSFLIFPSKLRVATRL
jgi:hypothetical protein